MAKAHTYLPGVFLVSERERGGGRGRKREGMKNAEEEKGARDVQCFIQKGLARLNEVTRKTHARASLTCASLHTGTLARLTAR